MNKPTIISASLALALAAHGVCAEDVPGQSGRGLVADDSLPARVLDAGLLAELQEAAQDWLAELEAVPAVVEVDFDDVTAPCSFAETTALRGFQQGVIFSAPGQNGGGILDECSGLADPGYSPPNFLAFSSSGVYADGGIAKPPMIIGRLSGASTIFRVSGGVDASVEDLERVIFVGIGQGITPVADLEVVTLTRGWQEVRLDSFAPYAFVHAILILGAPTTMLIDDLDP